MAKSLRSKSKLKAKSVKRNKFFSEVDNARTQRVTDRMNKELAKQKSNEENNNNDDDQSMKVDDKKPSTSGWRDSRKQQYKQKKLQKKKSKNVKF